MKRRLKSLLLKEYEYYKEKTGILYNGDCLKLLKLLPDNSIDNMVTDPPYGINFMGKKWDYDVPSVDVWKECLRVLKPGAHILVFAGTRTQHKMATNIENAGFILKDTIMWLYGSGFPAGNKDISKDIDKVKGKKRKIIGKRKHPTLKDSSKINRQNSTQYHASNPTKDEWELTAPVTKEAKLWEGWGTQLKPAYEPIILAMKPNEGTFANNALKYGVAGINIDGCRVGDEKRTYTGSGAQPNKINNHGKGDTGIGYADGSGKDKLYNVTGRWPSNIILDEEAGLLLDQQVGENKSCFFYCAKPSKKEKNLGCEGLEKIIGHNKFDKCKKCGKYIFQNPTRKSACKCKNPIRQPNKIKGNFHPTVKPLKLIEYLCALVKTPAGGISLDPYAGSGTTGVAWKNIKIQWILIEQEKDFCNISAERIKHTKIPIFR